MESMKMNKDNYPKLSLTGRISSLDMLRGLMLVIITLNHLGGPIKRFTFQPLGFVSAAEGFIYLSGYVYGLVYTRTYINLDYSRLWRKSLKRSSVIYFYHIIVLLAVIAIMLLNISDFQELRNFSERPVKSMSLFLVFLVQPQYMDILPLYVIFILFGPIVIKAFSNNKAVIVFIISLILWFLGQDKLFQYNEFDLIKYGLEPGNFNIISWQLLFIAGIYFGYLRTTASMVIPIDKRTIGISLLALIIFISARYSSEQTMFYSIFSHFSERSSLGIFRLMNFSIIAYLIYVLSQKQEWLFHSKWLSLLGRNSLQVFAFSVFLIYIFSILQPYIKSYGNLTETFINLILVGSLTIPAWLHQYSVKQLSIVKSLGL